MSDVCNPDNCSTIGVLQLKIDGLKEQIEQQADQIESMRNCGNCKNLNNCCGYDDNDFLDCNNYERWEWEG